MTKIKKNQLKLKNWLDNMNNLLFVKDFFLIYNLNSL
jgi:hypothetical protein